MDFLQFVVKAFTVMLMRQRLRGKRHQRYAVGFLVQQHGGADHDNVAQFCDAVAVAVGANPHLADFDSAHGRVRLVALRLLAPRLLAAQVAFPVLSTGAAVADVVIDRKPGHAQLTQRLLFPSAHERGVCQRYGGQVRIDQHRLRRHVDDLDAPIGGRALDRNVVASRAVGVQQFFMLDDLSITARHQQHVLVVGQRLVPLGADFLRFVPHGHDIAVLLDESILQPAAKD